jgi:hypothetical protein
MPKINQYVVKIIRKSDSDYGLYYDGMSDWVKVNKAKYYNLDYVNKNLALTNGYHALLKVEENGTLTRIR